MPSLQLRDVCTLITDGTHYTPPDIGDGVPFLTVMDIDDRGFLDFDGCSKIAEAEYEKAVLGNSAPMVGDVLFSKDGTVGKVSIVSGKARFAVLSSIAILRPNNEIVDSNYLGHALKSPYAIDQALKKKTGSAIRRIILSDLKEIYLPIPDLPEQRRISAILDKANALRDKRRETIAKIDHLLQSVFVQMFGAADSWKRVAVGEMCDVKGGKRLPKGEDYSAIPTPFRYIRVSDIEMGAIHKVGLRYLRPETQGKIKRYTVKKGDVVITIAGTIGVVAPVSEDLSGANLTENAAKLVSKGTFDYEPDYLAFALSVRDAQSQIQSRTGQVTIGKLALFRIEQIEIPLPPIDLQRKFVSLRNSILDRNIELNSSKNSIDYFISSLQKSFFS